MSQAIALASLFSSDLLQSSFDAQAHEQALTGRTFAPLLTMLDGAYGLSIPAGTVAALRYLNMNLFGLESAPKLAKGIGAVAATVTVTQALHAYATVLLAGMSAAKRADMERGFDVLALPAWADPVQIAKAKALKKAKRDAAAAVEAAANGNADEETAGDGAPSTAAAAPRVTHADALTAWAQFASFLGAGLLTASERDAFIAQLETAIVAPEAVPVADKAEKRARRAKQSAADAVAKAAMLASFNAPVAGEQVAEVAA